MTTDIEKKFGINAKDLLKILSKVDKDKLGDDVIKIKKRKKKSKKSKKKKMMTIENHKPNFAGNPQMGGSGGVGGTAQNPFLNSSQSQNNNSLGNSNNPLSQPLQRIPQPIINFPSSQNNPTNQGQINNQNDIINRLLEDRRQQSVTNSPNKQRHKSPKNKIQKLLDDRKKDNDSVFQQSGSHLPIVLSGSNLDTDDEDSSIANSKDEVIRKQQKKNRKRIEKKYLEYLPQDIPDNIGFSHSKYQDDLSDMTDNNNYDSLPITKRITPSLQRNLTNISSGNFRTPPFIDKSDRFGIFTQQHSLDGTDYSPNIEEIKNQDQIDNFPDSLNGTDYSPNIDQIDEQMNQDQIDNYQDSLNGTDYSPNIDQIDEQMNQDQIDNYQDSTSGTNTPSISSSSSSSSSRPLNQENIQQEKSEFRRQNENQQSQNPLTTESIQNTPKATNDNMNLAETLRLESIEKKKREQQDRENLEQMRNQKKITEKERKQQEDILRQQQLERKNQPKSYNEYKQQQQQQKPVTRSVTSNQVRQTRSSLYQGKKK